MRCLGFSVKGCLPWFPLAHVLFHRTIANCSISGQFRIIWNILGINASRLGYSVRTSRTVYFDLWAKFIVSVWGWLSSAIVINICISIVLAWLNTNSSISGLAQQFPLCFKTNTHTYWCFSSSETGFRHRLLLSFCLMENITSVFGFHILSFLCVHSFIPFSVGLITGLFIIELLFLNWRVVFFFLLFHQLGGTAQLK